MRCPCCEKSLKVTHRDRYQDLSDHVSNPNGEPPMKNGYQCMNEYCIANNLRCVWIESGEIFIHPPNGIKWDIAHRVIEKFSVSGLDCALDSWMHHYELGKLQISKRKKTFNIFKFRVEIEPHEKGWKYPEDQRYQPSSWRYKFTFWKKTSDHGYSLIVPDIKMVRFVMKEFKNSYKRVIEHEDDYHLEKCFRYLFGKENSKETRYEKIARWILAIFYQEEKKNIVHLYQMKFAKREWI